MIFFYAFKQAFIKELIIINASTSQSVFTPTNKV